MEFSTDHNILQQNWKTGTHTYTPESDMSAGGKSFFGFWPVASFSKHWKLKYMVTQQRTHR